MWLTHDGSETLIIVEAYAEHDDGLTNSLASVPIMWRHQCRNFAYIIINLILYLSDLLSKSSTWCGATDSSSFLSVRKEFCHAQICCQISTDADSFFLQMYIVGYDSDHHQSRVVWVTQYLSSFWIFSRSMPSVSSALQIIRSDTEEIYFLPVLHWSWLLPESRSLTPISIFSL